MDGTHRHDGARAVAAYLDTVLADTWALLSATFGSSAVRLAIRLAEIVTIMPGIYAASANSQSFEVRARAAALRSEPRGRLTGLAATHMWGVVDQPPQHLTIQVDRNWHLHVPQWIRVLRVPYDGRKFRIRGIRVADVPDAVVQSWREARPDVGAATVIAAVVREKCTAAELLEALERRKQMPRRGQLAQLIGLVGNTVTSYLEYVAWREVFPPRQFPHLRWQVEMWPRGRRRVMDAFDPEARIDLEFDGGSTHGGVDGFERDRERDADMRHSSIEPLHFTYRDLTQRPEWCRSQYRALREQRLGGLGGNGASALRSLSDAKPAFRITQ